MLQTDFLIGLHIIGDLEGRSLRFHQELGLVDDDFDASGRQIRILLPFRPFAHHSGQLDHVFGSELVGKLPCHSVVGGIEDGLCYPVAISQVDEDDPSVIAPIGDPPGQGDRLPDVAGVQLSASVCPMHNDFC